MKYLLIQYKYVPLISDGDVSEIIVNLIESGLFRTLQIDDTITDGDNHCIIDFDHTFFPKTMKKVIIWTPNCQSSMSSRGVNDT